MLAEEVRHNGTLLAKKVSHDAWQSGLSFHSAESDSIQVGTWEYESGQKLKAHVHNVVPREVKHTQEVVVVMNGRVRADIFTREGERVAQLEAGSGDVLILLDGGHGYEILEDGTRVIEVKNGPYYGAEVDRHRLPEG